MADYQLYLMDSRERIRRRLDLDCRDDAHAVEVVGAHVAADPMELWQGPRLVKRFEPEVS